MAEFVIVGPIVAMLGLSILQYGMLFFAKNQINHAGFMAARAGAMMNADVAAIEDAYLDALIPIYGGGTTAEELSGARQRAREDMTAGPNGRLLKIEMLSPSKESFDDWNDVDLQQTIGNGRRVVPNSELASRDPGIIGERSGQSIQDANLIKLRITHAYEPKVPLTGAMYNRVLRWLDVGGDMDYSRMLRAGRVPLVTHVTLNMHSDAIEPVAPPPVPGLANTGEPRPPGGRPDTTMPAPVCTTAECNIDVPPGIERSKDAGGGDQETGNPEPPACA
ncbi:MAG TPA: TadE family protein [Noviherbaspirillum sp.]|jgi:hypothetical protein|uniref:TadE/TadG family type IV pilus assembly protein n=1 Tax=Noviherbaspirillum sp. TaxID=1926288 RepID=UPI002F95DDF1